jgi:helicase required for RNAi-mediated heterochromatin assembly 1
MWDGEGRPVPGMQSCIYFWNLPGNAESRPMAGLSACNQAEAAAVVALVKHLQLCGVPGAAVSVITPYKGQKMLITKLLRKEKCLPAYVPNQKAPSPDCVYVSTVDRYQGDENDIVILSLVRTRPGNRFVALLNRFIVAVSRARLGFYIVGAVNGVTKTASGADGPVHWRDLVTQLSATPMPNPAEAGGFSRGRVGPGIPLCCPQHRSSVCDASSATEFPTAANWEKLCQETCSFALPCGHPCGKQCHCHKTTMAAHTDQCLVVLDRPCVRHQDVPLLCKDIPRPQGCSLARALGCFLCMEMVCFQRPECSHRVDVHCHTMDGSGPQLSDCAVRVGDFHHPACGHVFQQLTC